jgi:biotin-(acetyl-CoA carboxylase) ligase
VTFDDLRRPPLDPVALSAALTREGSLWREVELLPESPSTNADLAARARAGEPSGLVLVAEHQTSGRGRLDRKVAGILVERVERNAGAAAVVGVGLNVSSSREELPVPTATSLALEGAATVDRSVILREVLRTLEALYVQWQAELGDAGKGLLESYVRRCGTLGREVRVDLPAGEQVHGEAVGIDADGRLQVRTNAGLRVLGAGDVVHVRPV